VPRALDAHGISFQKAVPKQLFNHLRSKLLASMLAVIFLLTAAVLALVHGQLRNHVRQDLVETLRTESAVYTKIETVQREQARQKALLIADLPSLKALMSTRDRATVQDASQPIFQTSQTDLFILESTNGNVLGFFAKSADVSQPQVSSLLQASTTNEDWWVAGGHLFDVAFVPIVVGAGNERTVLGRIALGREITTQSILRSGMFGGSALVFERNGHVVLSSLPADAARDFDGSHLSGTAPSEQARDVKLNGERFLASSVELEGEHPLRLHFLLSYDQASGFLRALDHTLLILGTLAIIPGAFLAFVLSRQITLPLERLAQGTRRMEKGDFEFDIPLQGADEVADLTRSFIQMRNHLRQSREGMLRSARLEAVGRLAGGVAHDFNNLVMIIKGYSDLLLDSVSAEAKPQLEEIKKAGDRASTLTRQLLAFSRQQVLEPQVLDPNQSVRNMVKMLRVLIGEDIELVTSLSEEIGRIRVDPGQLEQVVMNLAVNARDAMPNGGRLLIETQSCQLDASYAAAHNEITPGQFVLLSVTDTGCGMSKETLAHIFEPFFTTKEPGKGTGLGLATVYGIVKQSHGDISVYSEPGLGTTFKIYLPAVEQSAANPLVQTLAALPKAEGTILLVEDEPALRKLAAESLKRLGYEVLQAGNGVEALAVAEAHKREIHVLVTDVVMPQMGGPELAEELRRKRTGVAVIFMSGYSEAAALQNGKLGADAVLLSKPFSNEQLARKIHEMRKPSTKAAGAGS